MASLLTAVTILISGALLLTKYAPGNMGTGFAVGEGITVLAGVVALWRSLKRPDSTTTLERTFTSIADERDRTVMQRSAAVVGYVAIPLTAFAAIALALNADATIVMAILLWAQLAIAIAAYVRTNARS